MSALEINIDDYLSEEEKTQIARDEFRAACGRRSQADFERILSNAGYALVSTEVDKAFGGKMAEVIETTAIKVIKELSTYTVFKRRDAWDKEDSKAYLHLQSVMDECRPLIEARVTEVIEKLDEDTIQNMIGQRVADAIVARVVNGGAK